MLDALRNHADPGLAHPERLALAIDAPLPRRVRRMRDRIGDAAGAVIIAALAWAALVALT